MKELLSKFFKSFSEGISLLKEEKSEEAIKKFEEASEMKSDLTKSAQVEKEETSEENLNKFFESEDWKEVIKKYVDMYLSATDVSSFMDQVKELAWNVSDLKKEKETDDKTVSEVLDKTMDEVEEIKKTLSNSRFSKID